MSDQDKKDDKNEDPKKPVPKKVTAKAKQKRLKLHTPPDLEAVYSNSALIANTPSEIVLDFVQVLPRETQANVKARVILSPLHAKLLQRALAQNIANYERQFGEIRVANKPNIADQFFGPPATDKKDE